MPKFFVKAFLIVICLLFIVSQKMIYAQVVPVQLYQANPKSYSYGGFSGNLNPYGIESYVCNPETGDVQAAQDTCIPGAQSSGGDKLWLNDLNYNSSNANDTCTPAQADFDAAPQSADTRTMNGTGQADADIPICATTWATTSPFPFIDVTKTFQYDPTFCNNGDEVVLATNSTPSTSCSNLDVASVISNPQNYSQAQRSCMLFVDDHFTIQACKNGVCGSQQLDGVAITGYGAHPDPLGTSVNVCSIFTAGAGSYQVTLQAFDQYQGTYGSSSVWLTDLSPTYTVSGNVFVDVNKNKTKDGGENNYAAAPVISASTGTVTNNADGSFTISNVQAGPVTVNYNSLPPNYYLTSPLNGPPPYFSVTVGPACSVNGAPGATCNAGNITNLNFGISNFYPWFQSTCGDIRDDSGITDLLPAGQSLVATNASCTTPGIAFTGDTNANLGQGTVAQVVGGSSYPEVFSPSPGLLTSYTSLLAKAQSARITPIDLSTVCSIANCKLPGNLPHGLYIANGDLTIANNNYTFNGNQNYVFLVNGNLTLTGNISITSGATALFSTAKNIIVSANIGSPPNNATSSLDGWYVAGQNFIVNSQNNCNDLRLNIGGAVIANALDAGGAFVNNRDLCGNDGTYPTVSVVQRLDMILNAPQFLKQQQSVSEELAP